MKKYGRILLIILAVIIGAFIVFYIIDPVGRDLSNYLNEDILVVLDMEDKVTDGWKSVSAENYIDDETLYNALKDHIFDDSAKLLDEAEKIVPKTKKLKNIHELYVTSISEQHGAFNLVVEAIEKEDDTKIEEANKKLAESRKLMNDYIDSINELIRKHNINLGGE